MYCVQALVADRLIRQSKSEQLFGHILTPLPPSSRFDKVYLICPGPNRQQGKAMDRKQQATVGTIQKQHSTLLRLATQALQCTSVVFAFLGAGQSNLLKCFGTPGAFSFAGAPCGRHKEMHGGCYVYARSRSIAIP